MNTAESEGQSFDSSRRFFPARDKTKKHIFIQPSCGQTHLHHGGLTLVIRLFAQVESKLI